MGLLADILTAIPKEIKIIIGIAIFVHAGWAILNAITFIWNILVVGVINLTNGCSADPEVCVPALDGIYFFGINFTDYWIVMALIFFPAIALFAIKWYSLMLPKH